MRKACSRRLVSYSLFHVYNPPKEALNLPDIQETVYHNTILAGDFNGHSPQWGYPNFNRTGHIIEELCGSTNLTVLQNKDSQPTLLHRRHLTLSRPDLTISSADLLDTCHIETLNDIGSDHRPTLLSLLTAQAAILACFEFYCSISQSLPSAE